MLVKIYLGKDLNKSVVHYALSEIFRYIDASYEFTDNLTSADIVYAKESNANAWCIKPSQLFWQNYKDKKSLPKSPLFKNSSGLTYIYPEDIIVSTFFLLSGYEEYLNPKRDRFDRFLYQYSDYVSDGIYDEPLVDRYREFVVLMLNRQGILCKRKNIWDKKSYGVFLTHDVDGTYKYRNTLKSIAKIILKPSKFNLNELIESKRDIAKDPYFDGFNCLMNASKEKGMKSTFFFIANPREKLDDFYSIDDEPIITAMKTIKANGFEVGIHGTLQSYNNDEFLQEELSLLGMPQGIRQHYLKYDIRYTSKMHSKYLKYDTTLSFADKIGFRRGTCLPFSLYDLHSEQPLPLIELPLLVMDQSLRSYMSLDTQNAYNEILSVIEKVKRYNGLFTFLWHPGNCSDEWKEWFDDVYLNVLNYLDSSDCESLLGGEILEKLIRAA